MRSYDICTTRELCVVVGVSFALFAWRLPGETRAPWPLFFLRAPRSPTPTPSPLRCRVSCVLCCPPSLRQLLSGPYLLSPPERSVSPPEDGEERVRSDPSCVRQPRFTLSKNLESVGCGAVRFILNKLLSQQQKIRGGHQISLCRGSRPSQSLARFFVCFAPTHKNENIEICVCRDARPHGVTLYPTHTSQPTLHTAHPAPAPTLPRPPNAGPRAHTPHCTHTPHTRTHTTPYI